MEISVCMGVKNGAAFLREQVESILLQLEPTDELVVSDDRSCDLSIDILNEINDPRIKVVYSEYRGIAANFENALTHCSGDLIFLSDQDDVWHSSKVKVMKGYLDQYDMVVSNCALIGEDNHLQDKLFFEMNRSGSGLISNLIHNSYIGCCMAFRRTLLTKALPFPKTIPMHDQWLGLVAELYFKSIFIDDVLVYHRRHGSNASTNGKKSVLPYSRRVSHRFHLISNLVKRTYA